MDILNTGSSVKNTGEMGYIYDRQALAKKNSFDFGKTKKSH